MKTTEKTCYNCGKKMHTSSLYSWHDVFLGDFAIPCAPEEYSYCDCGEELLAYSLCLRIEDAEQEKTEQLLLQSVNGDMKAYKANLVRNKDLVGLLGKSRQAIQQDHRIKTLIYHHVEKSGEIVYWKPSVEQYKKTGDGRFDLRQHLQADTQACSIGGKMPMGWMNDDGMPINTLSFSRYQKMTSVEELPATGVKDIAYTTDYVSKNGNKLVFDFSKSFDSSPHIDNAKEN